MLNRFRLVTHSLIAWCLLAPATALSADLVVTRYFSGIWDQTHQESQGFVLQVIDQELDQRKRAVVYWFTYGDDLETAWYMGIGEVMGDEIHFNLYSSEGVAFMEADAEADNPVHAVGILVLVFHNCNKGMASFEIDDVEPGEFEIRRLTGLYNSRCSGGISDNTPGDAKPVKLEVDLDPAREGIDGSGEATFWERTDRSDFKVHVRQLADGDYTLKTSGCAPDDEIEDGFTVVAGSATVEYRSPPGDSKRHLTFDPRECRIDILDGEGAALTSGDNRLEEKQTGQGGGNGGDNGGGHGGGNGRDVITLALTNHTGNPEAEAEAEYVVKNNSVEFEVELERVLEGPYTLYVDHVDRGTIQVVQDGDKTKGRIRFSDPQKEERLLLEFPVLNSLIEIEGASGLVFDGTFPSG